MSENELDTPQKRLEYFLDLKGLSYADFARAVGASPYSKSNYAGATATSVFRRKDIVAKMEEIGLSYSWYLLGEGLLEIETNKEPDADYMVEAKNVKMIRVPIIEKLEDLPYKDLMVMREKMTAYLNKINEMFGEKKD